MAALVIVFDYTLKYSGMKIPFPWYPNLKFDFTGVPIIMKIPEERGFMFCISILTVGVVILVALRSATVFLWSTMTPLIYLP